MNTPVSFSTAKLLKEKGFDEPCKLCVEDGDERPLPFNCGNTIHRNSLHPYYSAPTIAEVVMWLYEKHGIWIYPILFTDIKKFVVNIDRIEPIFKWQLELYDSPTEAYEAAIQHTLNNLI